MKYLHCSHLQFHCIIAEFAKCWWIKTYLIPEPGFGPWHRNAEMLQSPSLPFTCWWSQLYTELSELTFQLDATATNWDVTYQMCSQVSKHFSLFKMACCFHFHMPFPSSAWPTFQCWGEEVWSVISSIIIILYVRSKSRVPHSPQHYETSKSRDNDTTPLTSVLSCQ